jgi:hypothetical protein
MFVTFGELKVSTPQAADIAETMDRIERGIKSEIYHGYLPRPIPHALDHSPDRLLSAYLNSSTSDRELFQIADHRIASILQVYAERMAALAVRHSRANLVDKAVTALGLALLIGHDDRDVMLVMPLPWRSAELLGLEPAQIFDRAAACLPEPASTGLRKFARRAPKDRTLACMGYVESSDEGGFRYERRW